MVLAASPVSEYVVAVEPVLDTIVDQVVPPSVDLSILYPSKIRLLRSDGAVQLRSISEVETAFAIRFVGGDGPTVKAFVEAMLVIPISMMEKITIMLIVEYRLFFTDSILYFLSLLACV